MSIIIITTQFPSWKYLYCLGRVIYIYIYIINIIMQCPMGRIVGAWSCVQVFAKKFDASFASTPHIFIFEASFCEFLFYHTKFAISLHVLSLFSFLYKIYGHISSNNAKECGINTNFIFACENFSFRVFFSNFPRFQTWRYKTKTTKSLTELFWYGLEIDFIL